MKNLILVINPGSTSTKLSLFNTDTEEEVQTTVIRHTVEEISQFDRISDQKNFRSSIILSFLDEHSITLDSLKAVVGRGGLLKPIPGGTYIVDETMLENLVEEKYGSHASNLGAILANDIANDAGVDSYIVDPVVVDEMQDIARVSGLKGIERRSVLHALNQKAVARRCLSEINKDYESSQVIVAHLGGGVSVGAHKNGQMIDVVNGLDGEGPLTPERTGGLPAYDFAKFIIEKELTLPEVKKYLAGNGGLKSYLNETDIRVIEERANNGDKKSSYYLDAMCYQIAKAIGECAVVLQGNVDLIILTGGVAYSKYVTEKVNNYIKWISTTKVYPGEMEMEALFKGVQRVLNKEEKAKKYSEVD